MSFDIAHYEEALRNFFILMTGKDALANVRLASDHWTLKEMVGHLVDSASNNHQRFIRLQLAENLIFPGYQAEEWRSVGKVQGLEYRFLVNLWMDYNSLILHVVSQIPADCLEHRWESPEGPVGLADLVIDYYAHLQRHEDLFRERVAEITMHNQYLQRS